MNTEKKHLNSTSIKVILLFLIFNIVLVYAALYW